MANDSLVQNLSEHEVRVQKVEQLREQGHEPWAAVESVTATTEQVVLEQSKAQDDTEYSIAGRLMTIRGHGKTAFCHLQDSTGRLQIYLKQEDLGEQAFAFFKNFVDIGDIVWCKGTVFVTKMGELTLKVKEFKLLSKSLHPLPEKFHGIADIEIKYRQRYLDLIMSQETRERFKKRSHIIRLIRQYLDDRGYEEVETPMLHPIPGGAAARPFVTHHNALDSELYLRIAPELYLKRLVVGGIDKVYEINRNFRNEGVSTRHNPEFTMLEFYTAHKDYHYIMDFVEDMIKQAIKQIGGSLQVPYGETIINFDNFRRLSPYQAALEIGGISEAELAPDRIDVTCKEHDVKFDTSTSYNQKVFGLFEACAESKIIDPLFIVDFPIEISPLAQRDAKDPSIAARFELFIAGMELSNGFNELNDPFDQAARFKEQAAAHASGDAEAMHYDAEYITALEYGMPPAVGVGVGIDRLAMLLTNTTSIKEMILFPALKKK
jgi:lysyl-tRNA synthetase class 2